MNKGILVGVLVAFLFLSSCRPREGAPESGGAQGAPEAGPAAAAAAKAAWRCPMHPQIVQDHAGNCPICGMELVRSSGAPKDASAVEGTSAGPEVRVDAAVLRRIGVRTETVQPGTVAPELRVDAEAVVDPALEVSVTVRAMGYLEKVPPLREGDRVQAGRELASFYSPDLVAAQGEWLAARAAGDSASASASRQKLLSLGLPEGLLGRIQREGRALREVPLVSPVAGWIRRRAASPGQSAMAGQELFRIVSDGPVLLEARVPQERVGAIRPGTEARIEGGSLARPVEGRVESVLPEISRTDRTAAVRLRAGAGAGIRPGGSYQAVLVPRSRAALVVPEGGVLHSGKRDVVFLALGGGRFRPVEVRAGATSGGRTEVLDGVEAGDEVVVSAQFLLDGESRLQAALDQMRAGGTP